MFMKELGHGMKRKEAGEPEAMLKWELEAVLVSRTKCVFLVLALSYPWNHTFLSDITLVIKQALL